MTHLTYETLLNYLEERLLVEERSAVDAHLASTCESCGRHLALLRKVFETVNSDHITPPSSVLKRAIEIPLMNPRPPQPGMLTRITAALSFDSRLQLSSALTRGASREWHMLFTAEQVDIDLKISTGHETYDVLGQVLGTQQVGDALSAFVSLQSSTGQVLKATETDSLGQFAFHEISSGVYDLIFDLETQEIAVHGLEVGND